MTSKTCKYCGIETPLPCDAKEAEKCQNVKNLFPEPKKNLLKNGTGQH